MTSTIVDAVKRPLLVGIASGLCSTAVTMVWLEFPSAMPITVLMTVGFVGAVTFLVCGTIAVLRVAKILMPAGLLAGEIRTLPRRSLVALCVTLALCNGALIYFSDLRPNWVYVLVLNSTIIVSWIVARLMAARHVDRREGPHGT